MYSPLISPEWDFAIWAVLVGIASFGFWVDSTRIGKRVSGVGIMLVSAMLLGNFGVIPHAAPAYDVVWSYLVPVAVPLLLLKANLRRIIPETGPMLGAYFLGVTGTVIGAVLGFLILPIGDEGADLAGILSASYIGGSMNFAAVAEALEFDDGTLLTAALAADNVVGTVHLLLVALIPSVLFLRRWIPSPIVENSSPLAQNITSRDEKQTPLNVAHLSFALMLSLAICAAGYGVANYVAMESFGILFVTVITLIIANIFHDKLKDIDGEFEAGMLLMYVFFATIGAGADVGVMLDGGLMIFVYASLIVMTHVLVILVGAKFLKMDLAEIVIASLACVGGPVAPVAVASSRGWHALVTPGLMVGILGYAIANFIGVGVAQLLG
jgi:uncharacterized membrane protein|tara:strand:+ start:762 stop:1907 length:1146 start_codon:yes stop_codon:yes gene_type:complete